MYRGSTPTLVFNLPIEADQLETAYVTVVQLGRPIIDKPLAECEADGTALRVRLTQEETLKMIDKTQAKVQFRGKTITGDVIISAIFEVMPEQILHDGVI